MTTYQISPSKLKGHIVVPPSKSHTARSLLFGLMGKGKTKVHNYLPSPDTNAILGAIEQFGAKITRSPDSILIEGMNGHLGCAETVIDAGNSGQVLRFIGSLAALSPGYTVITGDYSIRHNRPVKPLLKALQELGATALSSRLDGYAPIIIKGPMQPGTTSLPGEDSQPVSGLLMATSFLPGKTEIHVTNPGEKPWIDLTFHWLKKLGIRAANEHYTHYTVYGNAAYDGFEYTVPGDFSTAAFPIAAALVTKSEVTLHNIDMSDIQGDKKIIHTLREMGAHFEIDHDKKTLTVKKDSTLRGIRIDINDFIDAITICAVIACFAEGPTEIVNAAIARTKESDRIRAIATELTKMGARIEERPDGLLIHPSRLKGAELASYHDHRIALSLSIAALAASSPSIINGVECIGKTYGSFLHDFQKLGAQIRCT